MSEIDSLIEESLKHWDVLREYCQLATRTTLTDEEADRMAEIFQLAETDPLLSFLIDEVDHILGHELNLIDAGSVHEQQHQLSHLIDQNWIKIQVQKSRIRRGQDLMSSLKNAQTRLRAQGFYQGSIDGIYGPKTRKAFRSLREKLQNELKAQGLYSGLIDRVCGPETQEVIQTLKEKSRENGIDIEKLELLELAACFEC